MTQPLRFFASVLACLCVPASLCLAAEAAPTRADAAQPTATKPASNTAVPTAYDVISIHLHDPAKNQGSSSGFGDGKMNCENVSLASLFSMAYGVREGLISGIPSWANGKGWDIHAKTLDLSDDQIKAMHLTGAQDRQPVANMLAQRFGAKVHWETRQLPVYDLVVENGEPKFATSAAQNAAGLKAIGGNGIMWNMSGNETKIIVKGMPMKDFADTLANVLNRDVIDKTGLTGSYSFGVTFAPTAPSTDASTSNDEPSLFSALEDELGLKLVTTKNPVATLVIDHVDLPTEN